MQQHPVPQNVASYQFRLVGDMTLKQFGLLASGILVAFIIYQLPIHALLKWPFIFLSSFAGIALAFIPIEDRPLDRWLTAFLKSVYSPTQFFWQKAPTLPDYFHRPPRPIYQPESETPAKDRRQLTEYLHTLPSPPSDLTHHENQLLDNISQLFQNTQTPPAKLPSIKVRQLSDLNTPIKGEIRVTTPTSPKFKPQPEEPVVEFKPLLFTKQDLANLPSVTPTAPGPTQAATTNPRLPFPAPSETPNTIVGMVVDKYDRLVDSAIIEIRDANRHPVRAVKTNKIGQFFTATPLPNGRYEIVPEKDGFDFAIISLDLTGTIVNPLEIRALNEGPTPFK